MIGCCLCCFLAFFSFCSNCIISFVTQRLHFRSTFRFTGRNSWTHLRTRHFISSVECLLDSHMTINSENELSSASKNISITGTSENSNSENRLSDKISTKINAESQPAVTMSTMHFRGLIAKNETSRTHSTARRVVPSERETQRRVLSPSFLLSLSFRTNSLTFVFFRFSFTCPQCRPSRYVRVNRVHCTRRNKRIGYHLDKIVWNMVSLEVWEKT